MGTNFNFSMTSSPFCHQNQVKIYLHETLHDDTITYKLWHYTTYKKLY